MAKRPNILIFMTDHQRADTVLPEHPAITPNLTRLASQGVTFTNTYCPAPHCCPARATFMTGLYPSRHGVWNNICNDQALSRGLKPGVRCWSEDLRDAGYRLAYSGKWHVSTEEAPRHRGWEEIYPAHKTGEAIHNAHGPVWEQWREWANGDEQAPRGEGEILRPGWGTYRTYGTQPSQKRHDDEQVTDSAVETLREMVENSEPWCLFVGCIMPHDPYFAEQRFLDMYDINSVSLPPSYGDEMTGKPAYVRRMRRQTWDQLSEREAREAIRHFWASCTQLDEMFGRLLSVLDSSSQADDTLVLYCSDHGDYCGDHGLFCKGIPCYDGAYHVPAVVRWPAGLRNPNRRVDNFVSLADFAPTFQQLAGLATDDTLTGRSLMPLLRDEAPADWRDEIHTQCNGVEIYYTQRSVRTATHKYVYNAVDFDELYDLVADPDEMHNVADDPAYADIKRDLVRRMWRFAYREQDTAHNPYITLAMAPWGPTEAFRNGE